MDFFPILYKALLYKAIRKISNSRGRVMFIKWGEKTLNWQQISLKFARLNNSAGQWVKMPKLAKCQHYKLHLHKNFKNIFHRYNLHYLLYYSMLTFVRVLIGTVSLTWVKVQNFQNPELSELRSSNLQYAH